MRLIALETTTDAGSVALFENERLAAYRALQPEAYSMQLLPAIVALLGQLGWQPGELDAVAAAAGPGSFTGVRVGLAAVKGMIEAWGKPAIAVSTLVALAAAADPHAAPPPLDAPAIALLDALRGEVYFGIYPRGPLAAALAGPPPEVDPAEEAAAAQGAAARAAGALAPDARASVAAATPITGARREPGAAPSAGPPAAAAIQGVAAEGLESLEHFTRRLAHLPAWPVYLLDAGLGAKLGLTAARLRPRPGLLASGVGRLAGPLLTAGRAAGALELDALYIRRSDAELISLPRLRAQTRPER